MRAEIFAVLAIVALGTSGAMAQTTGENPADPSLKQEAPAADQAKPDARKARMPMRREQPIVPDTTARRAKARAPAPRCGHAKRDRARKEG